MTLYGPDGKPINPNDKREPWQVDWDRKFRNQMGGVGNYFREELIREVKKGFDIREAEREKFKEEASRHSVMDRVIEEYDDKVKTPKNRAWSLPSTKGDE